MRKFKITNHTIALLLPIVAAGFFMPQHASAGGFALLEQSAQGTGVAFAGATAGYNDASVIFFNPGAMNTIKKPTITVGGNIISPNANFSNDGSSLNPALGGMPLSGDNGFNGGVTAYTPEFFAVSPLGDGVTAGFGVNVPFGMSTQYSSDWVGRYSAIKTDLSTLALSPAISYELAEGLSVGAAINVLYSTAELSNAVDFGTIGVSSLGFPTASALGLLPQQADGKVVINGDDWGVGATAGVSYTFCEGSKIGITYRAPIKFTLNGDADFDVPANAQVLTSTGSFVDSDVKADITLPDSIAAGFNWQATEKLNILFDTQWTNWSYFDELRVRYESGMADSVVDESWKAVWRFSAGAEYKTTEDLKLKAGFTFDGEPVPDKYHRTPRIPSNDRYWLAVGADYNLTESVIASLAYAHLFVPEAHSDLTGSYGEQLVGSWDLSIDIVSAQFSYAF